MPKIEVDLNLEQLKEAIEQLSIRQKVKLVGELEKETWQNRFRNILNRIDERLKKNPISEKEVIRITEEARQKYYDRSRS